MSRRSRDPFDDSFGSFFREIPLFIWFAWVVGALISAGVTGFVLYLLYTLVMHVTS